MLVTPSPLRSEVSEGPDGLRIRIPAPRNLFTTIFLIIWLTGWAFGEWNVGRDVLHGKNANLFTYAWLAFWTCAGPYAFYCWLWNLLGQDIATVRAGEFWLRKQILELGRTRSFASSQMFNLRFVPESGAGRSHRDSRIAFDYGAKTYSFAEGTQEAEANQLIRLIRERLPISDLPTYSDQGDPEKPNQTWLKLN